MKKRVVHGWSRGYKKRIGWKLQYGRMYSKKKNMGNTWEKKPAFMSPETDPVSHSLPIDQGVTAPNRAWRYFHEVPGSQVRTKTRQKIYNQIVLQIRSPASPANQTPHGEVSAPQVAPGRLPSSSDGAPRFNWMICPGLADKGIRASVRGPKSYCKWLRTCYESPYVNIPYVSYMCVSISIIIYYLYTAHITLRKVQQKLRRLTVGHLRFVAHQRCLWWGSSFEGLTSPHSYGSWRF